MVSAATNSTIVRICDTTWRDDDPYIHESRLVETPSEYSKKTAIGESSPWPSGMSAGGNSLVTSRTLDPDGNWGTTGDWRTTTYTHDYRGRVILQANPQSPHLLFKYDDQSRVTATGQYQSTSGLTASSDPTAVTTNRRGLSETFYDERGQVYRSILHEVIQSGGSAGSLGNAITTDNWYDADGRLIKSVGATITKTQYDRLGRPTAQWLLALTNDGNYAAASGVSGDVVIQEQRTGYDADTGMSLLSETIERRSNDAVAFTGALDTNADGNDLLITANQVQGRLNIVAMWYDDWDRLSERVNYGRSDISGNASTGTNFNRGGLSVPSRSTTVERVTTTYDSSGRLYESTDQNAIVQRTEYDFAGRRTKVTDNYVDGTTGGGTPNDEDRIVEYAYTNGLMATMTRRGPSGGSADQVTTYTYGVDSGKTAPSQVASNALLENIVMPEQTSGQSSADRTIRYGYNALGQVLQMIDAGGNDLATAYDTAGRVIKRTATTVGSGFDSRVRRIETAYTSRGQVYAVAQYDATSSGTLLDEVTLAYDNWGNVETSTQDLDGSGARSADVVTYSHSLSAPSGGWQYIRPDTIDHAGQTITYQYDDGIGEVDEMIGRIVRVDDGIVNIASYLRYGVGGVDTAYLPEPDVTSSAAFTTRTDRFYRPTVNKWRSTNASADFVDLAITYDQAGNMTGITDNVLRDQTPDHVFDVTASYDDLQRLTEWLEGSPAAAFDVRQEQWTRNILGQATNTKLDLNANAGGGEPDFADAGEWNDNRTYGKRSNLLTRDTNASSPAEFTLTYDKNGNMTSDGESYSYVYNPWCQLVYVKNLAGSVTVAAYTYSGLGARISEQTDTNNSLNDGKPDGVVDLYDSVFYIVTDNQGRRLGTYRDVETDPKESFVWHPAGAIGPGFQGGPILRDRNADLIDPQEWDKDVAESSRGDRLYYCTDFRGNVVALLGPTGALKEQARYSATGVPFGLPVGDVDGDGDCDASDETYHKGTLQLGAYDVRGDFNLDGAVDSSDDAILTPNKGTTLGRLVLTDASVGNIIRFEELEYRYFDGSILAIAQPVVAPPAGPAVRPHPPTHRQPREHRRPRDGNPSPGRRELNVPWQEIGPDGQWRPGWTVPGPGHPLYRQPEWRSLDPEPPQHRKPLDDTFPIWRRRPDWGPTDIPDVHIDPTPSPGYIIVPIEPNDDPDRWLPWQLPAWRPDTQRAIEHWRRKYKDKYGRYPDQTCPPDVLRTLYEGQGIWCGIAKGKRCRASSPGNPGTPPCDQVDGYMGDIDNCIRARQQVMDICFANSPYYHGHHQAISNLLGALDNCRERKEECAKRGTP